MKAWKVELKDGNTRFVGAASFEMYEAGSLLFYNDATGDLTVSFAPGTWVAVYEALGVHIPNAQQRHAMIGTPETEEKA